MYAYLFATIYQFLLTLTGDVCSILVSVIFLMFMFELIFLQKNSLWCLYPWLGNTEPMTWIMCG